MIPKKLEAKILRFYYAEKWKFGTIAKDFNFEILSPDFFQRAGCLSF